MGLSTQHIDYLQRRHVPPTILPDSPCTSAAPALRRLWQVRGVGKLTRSEPYSPAGAESNYLMRDTLIGVYGYKIPVAFYAQGSPAGVSIKMGIWSPAERERASEATLDARAEILGAVLCSLYPDVDLVPTDSHVGTFTLAGMVLGQPSSKPPEAMGGTTPFDRLIRALYGSSWGVLVLADPIEESALTEIRNSVINEMRAVQADTQAMGAPSPLSELYQQLLDSYLYGYTWGQAEGAWRTAVYLLGDVDSYYRLASVWRSTFSGDESIPEPVRVFENSHVSRLARQWALPDVDGAPGPGNFRHPFSFQSLLTSSQLAHYVHLPRHETTGFSVSLIPDFDSVPPEVDEADGIVLGNVVDLTQSTLTPYRLSRSMLNRHALIAGVTGSGKTNTVFHLLTKLWDRRIPFLVLEPAKAEYRALLDHPVIGPDLRVFTPGDENVSPLRLNPFEVEPGISVATHIDLLKSVFNASFGMWNPLPQILERCTHAVYHDCGWDSARGGNDRLESEQRPPTEVDPRAFPTLTQLYRKVDEVVDDLGYDDRVSSDIKAALMTRLNSLRIGAKGMMLDTHRSVPLSELLRQPTIIELEAIGDDDEKAFVMGLLMVRIYEHLRGRGAREGSGLCHLTVIEEAHRLLTNAAPTNDQEQANTRGKAVETFVNMLSEVRAYGEGFLVAEQIPSKLASDVMKNTNIKVVHRVVSEDDRRALGGTMNMAEDQVSMLATLRTGQVAVFAEGDDKPLLVEVPYAKLVAGPDMATKLKSDDRLVSHMAEFRQREAIAGIFVPHALCPSSCGHPYRYCEDARHLVERKSFQLQFAGLVLAALLDGEALSIRLAEVQDTVRALLPERSLKEGAYYCVLLNAVEWYITQLGRHYHWKYRTAHELQKALSEVLVASMRESQGSGSRVNHASNRLDRFSVVYHQACRRTEDPFPACSQICRSGECLFRYHNLMLMDDKGLREAFDLSMADAGAEGTWTDLNPIGDVIARFSGDSFDPEHQRSLGLCYGVQRITFSPGMLEKARRLATQRLIEDYDAAR
jgi:hypothetical protein